MVPLTKRFSKVLLVVLPNDKTCYLFGLILLCRFFPAPLALLIPPPILLVHMQFSLIYQIWLHTEVIGHLGPLEYLINTPRQHRVHHGKNPYCIDKNYGALLMIWDRLFGTYQAEEETIRFGTTKKGYETFDSVTLHFYYYYDVLWAKVRRMECWSDRVKAVFYGPGWEPGKPRTGLLSDIPKVDLNAPIERYDREIPFWATFYVIVHAFLIALGAYIITDRPLVRHSPLNALLLMLCILLALTVFGTIFDRRAIIAPLLESLRCALFFPFDVYIISLWTQEAPAHLFPLIQVTLTLLRLIHLASLILWLAIAIRDLAFFQMKPSVSDSKEQIQKVMKPPPYPNSLEVNPRAAWQMAIYVLLISTIALPLILALYALNFTECQQILRHTLSQQIEL